MLNWLILIFISLNAISSYAKNQVGALGADCKLVGNYIYDHAYEVHWNMYALYNGYLENKTESYRRHFYAMELSNLFSWDEHRTLSQALEEEPNKTALEHRLDIYKKYIAIPEEKLDQEKLINIFSKNHDFLFSLKQWGFESLFLKRFCEVIAGETKTKNCTEDFKVLLKFVDRKMFELDLEDDKTQRFSSVLTADLISIYSNETLIPRLYKILQKMSSLKPNNLKNHNLISILKDEFSKPSDQKILWELIGVYSTRGASHSVFARRFGHEYRYLGILLTEIFNRIHYLNAVKETGENLVTLPRIQKNSCVYGKAYHFWMAARLAHYLKDVKKVSAKRAFTAAFASGILYNYFGSGADQRKNTFERIQNDEIMLKSVRQSILFQAAGAYLGSNHELNDNLDLDLDFLYSKMSPTNENKKALKGSMILPLRALDPFMKYTGADAVYDELINKL